MRVSSTMPLVLLVLLVLLASTASCLDDLRGQTASTPQTGETQGGTQGSTLDFSGRYYFHAAYMDWNNAAQYCRGNQSHLAYPYSKAEADTIEALMASNDASQIHIGMHDLYGEGKYYTIQGDFILDGCYSKWGTGYPVGGPLYDCGGYINPDGLLDQSCSDLYPFICEKDLWADYELLGGTGHYKLHEEYLSWANASATCEAEGAHLLIANSEEEYTLLRDEHEFEWCWVGLQQVLEDREFVTLFGDSMYSSNYSRWAPGEPTGRNTQYPFVKLIDISGLFNSYSEGPFICEHELV